MKKKLLVLVALLSAATTFAQNGEFIQNYVEVTGCSELELTPDTFYLSITIDESNSKGRTSVSDLEEKMVKELKKIGVNVSRDLKLNSLSSNLEKKRSKVYTSVKYTLKLDSRQRLIEAFDLFDELYISNVYLERTESSQIDKAKADARKDALRSAEKAAKELTSSVGESLGRCIYICDMSNDYSPSNYGARMLYSARSNAKDESARVDGDELELQAIKLNYRVKARFEID